jgi:alcohol dehydrogenase class IV
VGGYFNVPHGVVCGTLLAPAIKATIRKLEHAGDNTALDKFARMGSLFSDGRVSDRGEACGFLVEKLYQWSETLNIPRLGRYGISPGDVEKIVRISDSKDNPVALNEEEMKDVLLERI